METTEGFADIYGEEDTAKSAAEAILNNEFEELENSEMKEGFAFIEDTMRSARKEMRERGLLVKTGISWVCPKSRSVVSRNARGRGMTFERRSMVLCRPLCNPLGALHMLGALLYPDDLSEGELNRARL
jgi:hypothetical protein